MQKGKVKWFSAEKGYGFINTDNKEDGDIFVHYSQIVDDGFRTLNEGEDVEFEYYDSDKGMQAKSVKKLDNK